MYRSLGSLLAVALGTSLGIAFASSAYQPEFSTAGFFETDAEVRAAINFNVGWRFIKADVLGAHTVEYKDADWRVVNLPDGLELLPLSASGGVNYQGPAWYRKHFSVEASLQSKRIVIHFEGIMGKAKIWLNGELVKEHTGGYLPIHLDVTELVRFGSENVIAVRADNSNDPDFPPGKTQETMDFTYFGGIYRDVWLVTHNEVHVTHPLAVDKVAGGGVFVRCENVSDEFASVRVDVDLVNKAEKCQVQVHLELKDKNGNRVAHTMHQHRLSAGKSVVSAHALHVNNPLLWSPDHPHLYDLFLKVKDQSGNVLDAFRKRVGIRSIELRGREGFFLNGKQYMEPLVGANRHQDFAHIGHALPNSLHWRDALKLRRVGMRVIRSAHYVQDPAFMDACDALGLFVVATIPGWQFWNEKPIFGERMLRDVRQMIRLERNRPSVLLWEVVPNETHIPLAFAEQATQAAKEEYPYSGCYTANDARDKRGKNQHLFEVLYADDTVWGVYKDKSVFKREWGDFVDNWVDHNSVSRVAKQWGEEAQIRQAMHYFKEEWTENGVTHLWPSLTKIYGASRSLVGATLWHSFDHQRGYHPEPFWGGIMDAYRQPKFSYYLFKSLLPVDGLEDVPMVEAGPFVYIAHLMTPFSPTDVVVFSNCDEVRLTLFGEQVGVKKTTDPLSPVPRVPVVFKDVYAYVDARNKNEKEYGKKDQPFVEGAQMIAEGLIDGEVVAEHTRWPVGRKRQLVLKMDHSGVQPLADGSDITPVVAYLVDAGGGVKRLSDEYIRFRVEGAGELIAGLDSEINPQRLLWGEAVALVRSGMEPGKITVQAEVLKDSINGPDSAEITFKTIAPKQPLLYEDWPAIGSENEFVQKEKSRLLDELQGELRAAKKQLLRYELNDVGRQQQEFIQ